jgi:transposase
MAKGYRPVARDQVFLLPPDMREWLPEDHPVWLVIEAVGLLDTSAFHAGRRTGGAGAAGYDPDMLAALLVWAYANRVTSSRRIERLCGQDVAFRVICGGCLPDHVTVARFRKQFADAAAGLFAQVLVLCAQLGMGKLGVVALDGTKIAASASKEANRTEEGLRKLAQELAAEHAATDEREDALFGAGRGDEVPGDPHTRRERIAAALASAAAERERREAEGESRQARAAEHVEAARAGTPVRGRPAAGAEVAAAREQLARETAAQQARCDAWQAAGLPSPKGRRPVPPQEYCRVRAARARLDRAVAAQAEREAAAGARTGEQEPVRRNITDPDSRLMPVRGGGFIQGYNAQNVFSEDGLVIATELTDEPVDTPWFEPMMNAAEAAAGLITTAHRPAAREDDGAPSGDSEDDSTGTGSLIGLALADAGYLSVHNLSCPGPDRLIATGKHRDLEKRARDGEAGEPAGDGGGSPLITAMTERLATEDGITAYRRRSHIGETAHGNIKHNLGFRQLTMRGKRKASGEWTFICAVHNLMTAITSGHLTRQALTSLAS